MPLPLSVNIPSRPGAIVNPVAVKASPSASLAFARSSARVIRRAPLSSSIGDNITGIVVGASATGVMSSVAVPVILSAPSVTI